MTKALFIQNIKSSTLSMYLKAFVASFILFAVIDMITAFFLTADESQLLFDPLNAMGNTGFLFGVIVSNIIFLLCIRGFIGHLQPNVAFKKVFIFFLALGIILNGPGVIAHELTILMAILFTIMSALGNGVSAYFLGKSIHVA
jgi:hypothetical protein